MVASTQLRSESASIPRAGEQVLPRLGQQQLGGAVREENASSPLLRCVARH